MYKVFINDKPLFLADSQQLPSLAHCAVIEEYQSQALLHEAILSLQHNGNIYSMVIWHHDVEKVWNLFKELYTIIEAAGGVVKNEEGSTLFIYRMKKWDLPKGKVEKGEKVQEAAIREVEEECGIHGVKIVGDLLPSYHTYHTKGKDILKITHWFRMAYSGKEALIPQEEEGITNVAWLGTGELEQVIDNTYSSIVDVLIQEA